MANEVYAYQLPSGAIHYSGRADLTREELLAEQWRRDDSMGGNTPRPWPGVEEARRICREDRLTPVWLA